MKIHFFKAYSRLGMIYIPMGGTKLNLGVEKGSDAVLTRQFLKSFKNSTVSSFTFPLPEQINVKKDKEIIAHSSKQFADFINENLKENEVQFVIGGDHSVAFSSLLAVLARLKTKKVGYIQFDSHGDINLFKTSPTGNFHGMWLRPFIGNFDSQVIKNLVKKTIPPKAVLYFGDVELDPEEKRFFKENKIRNFREVDLVKRKTEVHKSLKKYVSQFDHLHVSFDIDVFAKKFVRATGTPSKAGLSPAEVLPLLKIINKAKSLSVDLIEVNPDKRDYRQTVKMAQKVLTELANN